MAITRKSTKEGARQKKQKKKTAEQQREGIGSVREVAFWATLVIAVQILITLQHQGSTKHERSELSVWKQGDVLRQQFTNTSHLSSDGQSMAHTSSARRSKATISQSTSGRGRSGKERPSVGTFNGVPIRNLEVPTAADPGDGQANDKNEAARQAADKETSTQPSLYSQIHCVGDAYTREVSRVKMDTPWMSRSCKFELLCYDTHRSDFVVFQDPKEQEMARFVQERPFLLMSQSVLLSQHVHNPEHNDTDGVKDFYISLGGINQKWGHRDGVGIPNLKWFPRIIETSAPVRDIHMLPSNVVLAPFHSLAAFNPGHLVWDDWLPVFTLLTMFQFDNVDDDLLMPRPAVVNGESSLASGSGYIDGTDELLPYEPLLMRVVVADLWATCDWKPNGKDIGKEKACHAMHNKFGALITKYPVLSTNRTQLSMVPPETARRYVCARQGVAGMGSLTDHGISKGHGFHRNDYDSTQNLGRGGLLWKFRTYMMRQLNERIALKGDMPLKLEAPRWNKDHTFRVTFSVASSDKTNRRLMFKEEIAALNAKYNAEPNPVSDLPKIEINSYKMSDHSMAEQVEIVSQSAVYVTACGGGAVTASFLPKGATLFLYCHEKGGIEHNKFTGLPARLDWDLFNALSYVRVMWMPVSTRKTQQDLSMFVDVVQHSFELLIQQESETL